MHLDIRKRKLGSETKLVDQEGDAISINDSNTANPVEEGLIIRELQSAEDFRAFEELQKDVWGQNLVEVITAPLARIVQRIGGIAAGAFDRQGAMLGLVFGFTGIKGGIPVHWSHMLAVRESVRDTGLGRKLKLYQRDMLLQAGIKEMYWTFDPLVARNAHLNFNSLGVEVIEYVPDMYGPGDDSELFRGLGTDRFIVVWRIGSVSVEKALESGEASAGHRFDAAPLVVSRSIDSDPLSAPWFHKNVAGPLLRVEVPPDIHFLRDKSADAAAQWRTTTRNAFGTLLGLGYRVTGFYREKRSGRCFYCLEK